MAGARAGEIEQATLLATCRAIAALNGPAAALMVEHCAHATTDVTGFLSSCAIAVAVANNTNTTSVRFIVPAATVMLPS